MPPKLPLPRGWKGLVTFSIVHVLTLGQPNPLVR